MDLGALEASRESRGVPRRVSSQADCNEQLPGECTPWPTPHFVTRHSNWRKQRCRGFIWSLVQASALSGLCGVSLASESQERESRNVTTIEILGATRVRLNLAAIDDAYIKDRQGRPLSSKPVVPKSEYHAQCHLGASGCVPRRNDARREHSDAGVSDHTPLSDSCMNQATTILTRPASHVDSIDLLRGYASLIVRFSSQWSGAAV